MTIKTKRQAGRISLNHSQTVRRLRVSRTQGRRIRLANHNQTVQGIARQVKTSRLGDCRRTTTRRLGGARQVKCQGWWNFF